MCVLAGCAGLQGAAAFALGAPTSMRATGRVRATSALRRPDVHSAPTRGEPAPVPPPRPRAEWLADGAAALWAGRLGEAQRALLEIADREVGRKDPALDFWSELLALLRCEPPAGRRAPAARWPTRGIGCAGWSRLNACPVAAEMEPPPVPAAADGSKTGETKTDVRPLPVKPAAARRRAGVAGRGRALARRGARGEQGPRSLRGAGQDAEVRGDVRGNVRSDIRGQIRGDVRADSRRPARPPARLLGW